MTTFFSAWHYDGQSAVRKNVELQVAGSEFFLVEAERRFGPFGFSELRFVGTQGESAVYGLPSVDGWRLGLKGPLPAELASQLPATQRYGGWIDRIGLGRATAIFAGISAVVLAVVLLTPQWLAPLIPGSVEKKLGNALIGDFGGRFCHTPEGSKALEKLVRSIDNHPQDLRVEVAKIDIFNAVALPGNNVILFDGLVSEAKSPDEVAGVLAHEIGHVRERHVMQALIRQMGLSVVLGGMNGTGGNALGNALAISYTRGSESAADRYSIQALNGASISPMATAQFFDRLAEKSGEKQAGRTVATVAGYISSHPMSGSRKKAFEASVVKGKAYQPALTPAEWNDLKTMCAKDNKAKSGFGLDFN